MYKPKLFIALVALLPWSIHTMAQQVKPDTAIAKPTGKTLFVNTGLMYISNLTYAGRSAPSSVPVLLPTLTLISSKGFFVSAIGYFDLNGSKSDAEGLSITPGYVFSFDKKKQYGGVLSATKYFITNNSPIILSTFDATIDGQLYINPQDIVKITVAGTYRFGKGGQNDVINDIALSKEIQVTKSGKNNKDGFKITPELTLYTGTQTFTENIVNNNLLIPTTTQQQVKKYTALALTGAMQFGYTIKTWQINFTPYLIQPYNQVDSNNNPQQGTYFLFTAGVNVTF